jgi:hypothetical protein
MWRGPTALKTERDRAPQRAERENLKECNCRKTTRGGLEVGRRTAVEDEKEVTKSDGSREEMRLPE